jgi:protein TonB
LLEVLVHHEREDSHWLVSVLAIIKYPAVLVLGSMVTIFLLYLMQYLIDSGEEAITSTNTGNIVDFIRIKEEQQVQLKQRRPKPPPEPQEPPPPIKQSTDKVALENAFTTQFNAPLSDINISNTTSFSSDGEYLPILKVQPVYPRQALQRGMFGWVLLEFTVDELGRVKDPAIISNCVEHYSRGKVSCSDRPGRMFDKAALGAAGKFKYKPRVVDGEAIATSGVKNMITFELDEMQNQ